MKTRWLGLFLPIIFLGHTALGQVSLSGVTYIKHFQQGVNYNGALGTPQSRLFIEAVGITPGGVTWQYCTGPGCTPTNPLNTGVDFVNPTDPLNGMGISPLSAGSNQVSIGGALNATASGELQLTLKASKGATVRQPASGSFPVSPTISSSRWTAPAAWNARPVTGAGLVL